jgi:hypothetical protein
MRRPDIGSHVSVLPNLYYLATGLLRRLTRLAAGGVAVIQMPTYMVGQRFIEQHRHHRRRIVLQHDKADN